MEKMELKTINQTTSFESTSPEKSKLKETTVDPVTLVGISNISNASSTYSASTPQISVLDTSVVSPLNSEPSFLSQALSTLGKVATVVGFILCLPIIFPLVLILGGTSWIDSDNDGGAKRAQAEAKAYLKATSAQRGENDNAPAKVFINGRWQNEPSNLSYNDLLENAGEPRKSDTNTYMTNPDGSFYF
jgi:hypothetical protein